MPGTVAEKLVEAHLVEGTMEPGKEVALKVDQTLTQDATGTMVMLEFEALGIPRVRTEVSCQYVDHNLLQTDEKNADDHYFLYTACQKFGVWYSRPGNGVSHPVHMERFAAPGKLLLGSDSHTPASGSMGMLAMGAGGLEVALAMAGEPVRIRMPEVWGVELTGELPDWVSAKDVILEMLRRHGVEGGLGRIIEYHGEGLKGLDAMDRHVIANMGTELGATTTVFPSDEETRIYLEREGRGDAWREILPEQSAEYHLEDAIDLSELEPLIALPSSPGNVVPVADVAGDDIYQAYVGSSANPGLRDFWTTAEIVKGKQVHPRVSFDVNPTSRELLQNLVAMGSMNDLYAAGARIHQAGCNGCIGMGQAPATHERSLRTVPRNFPGRSGTGDDLVYLVSPETAAASALTGVITDPRTLDIPYPRFRYPENYVVNTDMLVKPLPLEKAERATIRKGPHIASLPSFEPILDQFEAPVLLKVGDDISTDEIMPAGADILPLRSNIPAISEYTFWQVDSTYPKRAKELKAQDRSHVIVGGSNYGQGSSREHAAIAPRYLGAQVVLAKSFARIHRQNLVNFGVLPLTFQEEVDYDRIDPGDELMFADLQDNVGRGNTVPVRNVTKGYEFKACHVLSKRQYEALFAGGLLVLAQQKLKGMGLKGPLAAATPSRSVQPHGQPTWTEEERGRRSL